MTREEFVAQLDRGVAQASGSPVTGAVLRWTADQLKRGEPPWWKNIAKAWEKRNFVAWTEAWSLYLTALHFEALSDAESPLVRYFPSCGGTAEADPGAGLAKFFTDVPPSFYKNLRDRHRRTYSAPRSILWLSPAMLYFQRKRGLPYYVVEVNAGAGLDLAADAVQTTKLFDSTLVAARIGLDPEPLDLTDLEHRRWLTAAIFPEDAAGIAALDRAIDLVQKRLSEDGNFVQLAPCPQEKAGAFINKNVPADDPDSGLLVLNMGTTVRMSDADYAAYSQSIFSALKPWGNRGLWVEAETVRGEMYSTTLQVRVHRLVDGAPRSFIMASIDLATGKQVYTEGSAALLEVK